MMADDEWKEGPSQLWSRLAQDSVPIQDVCPATTPRSIDFLSGLSRGEVIWTIIMCLITAATIGIYVEEIYHIHVYLKTLRIKRKAIILLGMYPVTSFNAMLTVLMPRASGLADLVITIYYALCMYMFAQMIFHHYGGKSEMFTRLQNEPIPLRSPPCCCCCYCLPAPPLTSKRRLDLLEFSVMQFVIFKPLGIYIIALVLVDAGPGGLLENQFATDMIYQALAILDMTSTLFAIYGNIVLLGMAQGQAHNNLKKKFYVLKGVLLLRNLQQIIISILVSTGVVVCSKMLDVTAQSKRIDANLVVAEMLILSVIARVYYRYDVTTPQPDDDEISIIGQDEIDRISTEVSGNYGSIEGSHDKVNGVITDQVRSQNTDENSVEFKQRSGEYQNV